MKRRSLRFLFSALAAALIAGCGGGGGGGTSGPILVPTQTPTAAPASAMLTLTISFPIAGRTVTGASRRPQYVSPNSTQFTATVNTVNGGAPPSWVTTSQTTALNFAGGGNCTVSGGTATCTLTFQAPPGSVNYTFQTLDGSNNVLDTATTTLTIVQGVNNTPTVTLQGVVKTVTVSGPTLNANDQTHNALATAQTLTVTAFDASGATIVNGVSAANYSNAITLTDNDAASQTTLSLNGAAGASSVMVSSPSDVVKIIYTGQAINSFTIGASGTGITGGGTISTTVNDVTLSGTQEALDDNAHGGLNTDTNYGMQTLFLYSASAASTITAAEVGFSNSPFSQKFIIDPGDGTGNTCGTGAGAKAVVTSANTPALTFTITAQAVGLCTMRFKESGTGYPITSHASTDATFHDGTFWVEVTSSTFTVH